MDKLPSTLPRVCAKPNHSFLCSLCNSDRRSRNDGCDAQSALVQPPVVAPWWAWVWSLFRFCRHPLERSFGCRWHGLLATEFEGPRRVVRTCRNSLERVVGREEEEQVETTSSPQTGEYSTALAQDEVESAQQEGCLVVKERDTSEKEN